MVDHRAWAAARRRAEKEVQDVSAAIRDIRHDARSSNLKHIKGVHWMDTLDVESLDKIERLEKRLKAAQARLETARAISPEKEDVDVDPFDLDFSI